MGRMERSINRRFRAGGRSVAAFSGAVATTARTVGVLTGALAIAGREAGKFEQTMASLAAITGARALGEVSAIGDEALRLSQKFGRSARAIAEGQLVIAQTGATMNEVVASSEPILALATATMENFELAARLVIRTINAFNQDLGDITDVTRAVNNLQFAVNNSVNSLQSLNAALKFAAPAANTLGIEMEDLTSAFMLTANAGLEAGIAGRSIGQGLSRLIRGGQRGASEMAQGLAKELSNIINVGGTLEDVVAQLEMRFGMTADEVSNLQREMATLDDAQLNAIASGEQLLGVTDEMRLLTELFGDRGARVFAILLGQSDKMREFRTTMELQVITAAEQAEIAMNNLASQTQIAFDRITAAIIQSGFADELAAILQRDDTQKALGELGDEIGKFLAEFSEENIELFIDVIKELVVILKEIGPTLGIAARAAIDFISMLIKGFSAITGSATPAIAAIIIVGRMFGLTKIVAAGFAQTLLFTGKTANAMAKSQVALAKSTKATGSAMSVADIQARKMSASQKLLGTEIQGAVLKSNLQRGSLQANTAAMGAASVSTRAFAQTQTILGGQVQAATVQTNVQNATLKNTVLAKNAAALSARHYSAAQKVLGTEIAVATITSQGQNKTLKNSILVKNAAAASTVNLSTRMKGLAASVAATSKQFVTSMGAMRLALLGVVGAFSLFMQAQMAFEQGKASGEGAGGGSIAMGALSGAMAGAGIGLLGAKFTAGLSVPIMAAVGGIVGGVTVAMEGARGAAEHEAERITEIIPGVFADKEFMSRMQQAGGDSGRIYAMGLELALQDGIEGAAERFSRFIGSDEFTQKLRLESPMTGIFRRTGEDTVEARTVFADIFPAERKAMQDHLAFTEEFKINEFRTMQQRKKELEAQGFVVDAPGGAAFNLLGIGDRTLTATPTQEGFSREQLREIPLLIREQLEREGRLIETSRGEFIIDLEIGETIEGLAETLDTDASFDILMNSFEEAVQVYLSTGKSWDDSVSAAALEFEAATGIGSQQFIDTIEGTAGRMTGFNFHIEEMEDGSLRFFKTLEISEKELDTTANTLRTMERQLQANRGMLTQWQMELQELVGELHEHRMEVANLNKDFQGLRAELIEARVSGAGTLFGFMAENAEDLGFTLEEQREHQEELIKATVFNEVTQIGAARQKIKDTQSEQRVNSIKRQMVEQEIKTTKEGIETQLDNIRAVREQIRETEMFTATMGVLRGVEFERMRQSLLDVGFVTQEQMSIINRIFDDHIPPLEQSLSSLEKMFDTKIEDDFDDVVSSIINKLRNLEQQHLEEINKQAANAAEQAELMRKLLEELGINTEELLKISDDQLVEWAGMVAAGRISRMGMEDMQSRVDTAASASSSLASALRNANESMVNMGFSAARLDEVLGAAARVEFLSTTLGFVNNFKELAESTGRMKDFSDVIGQLQNEILDSGSVFLDELLSMADVRTLSEIFAKQQFLEQNVNNNNNINLNAAINLPEGIRPEDREQIVGIVMDAVAEAAAAEAGRF